MLISFRQVNSSNCKNFEQSSPENSVRKILKELTKSRDWNWSNSSYKRRKSRGGRYYRHRLKHIWFTESNEFVYDIKNGLKLYWLKVQTCLKMVLLPNKAKWKKHIQNIKSRHHKVFSLHTEQVDKELKKMPRNLQQLLLR